MRYYDLRSNPAAKAGNMGSEEHKEMQEYISMLYGLKKKDRIFTVTKSYLHHDMDRGAKAADGAFLLQKEKRTGNAATLEISGIDQQDQKLYLMRNLETLLGELQKAETELWKEPPEPLVQKLKSLVKTALIRCFEAYDSYYRLNITNSNLHRENERLTKTNERLAGENENLRAENKNYKLLKKAFGSKQMDSLLEQAKAVQQSKQRGKHFRNNQEER